MKAKCCPLYLSLMTWTLTLLLLFSATEARYFRRYYERPVEDCQFTCNEDLYKCDLQCKYLRDLQGEKLEKCHSDCADIFLDCFVGCYSVNYSSGSSPFGDFGFK